MPADPPARSGDTLTLDEVGDWTALAWTTAGEPDAVVPADGVTRLLSLALELLTGAPDPRDEGFWDADAGMPAEQLAAEAAADADEARSTFLADRPDLVDLVERIAATAASVAP